MTKQCINPSCLADNPDDAKFCRSCGYAFTPSFLRRISRFINKNNSSCDNKFTLDTFTNIEFKPKSISNIKFINRLNLFICIIFIIIFLLFINIPSYYYREFDDAFDLDGLLYYHRDYLISIIFIIIILTFSVLLNNICHKIKYNLNADYIEEHFIDNQIVRIAKKSRLGLFNKKKKKVLILSNYTNIDKFDENHILLYKGDLKGLYSLTYNKIIVPTKFKSISYFTNAITTAISVDGVSYHFDVKGNKLK